MKKDTIQKEILILLDKSSISAHNKKMIKILLPVMEEVTLIGIHDILKAETVKISKLSEKQKRIELKYQVLTGRLIDANFKK